MSRVIWYLLFVSLPFSVFGIDLSRLYGHLRPPVQKRSGKFHTESVACLLYISCLSAKYSVFKQSLETQTSDFCLRLPVLRDLFMLRADKLVFNLEFMSFVCLLIY